MSRGLDFPGRSPIRAQNTGPYCVTEMGGWGTERGRRKEPIVGSQEQGQGSRVPLGLGQAERAQPTTLPSKPAAAEGAGWGEGERLRASCAGGKKLEAVVSTAEALYHFKCKTRSD